jgi:hypothetical protein
MKNNKEYLLKGKTLTGLMKWLNSEENKDFKKRNNTEFTVGDVQGYINRGYLPIEMGGNEIEKDDKIQDVKIYNIVKNDSKTI